jgi:hypothetical protein
MEIGPIAIYAVDDQLRSPRAIGSDPPTQLMIRSLQPQQGQYFYVLVPLRQIRECAVPWAIFDNALRTLEFAIDLGEMP